MRHSERRSGGLFRGSELFRLISMAGMLVLLGALLISNRPASLPPRQPLPDQSAAPPTGPSKTATITPEKPLEASEVRPGPSSEVDAALTDLDPEQRKAALEEFEAITDKTTEMQREEMPAYWRVMTWVDQQPLQVLKQRAKSNYVLNDLLQEPGVHRGELLKLELNVRRVLTYDVPENALGLRRLYEIWGWTSESQAWPYVMVTPALPAGIPIGPDVSGRAIFCGYFFKLQGYLEAGANPRDKPLVAPLLIGRIEPREFRKAPLVGNEAPWVIIAFCVLGLFFVGRIAWLFLRRPRIKAPTPSTSEVRDLPADEWLAGLRKSPPGKTETRDFREDEA